MQVLMIYLLCVSLVCICQQQGVGRDSVSGFEAPSLTSCEEICVIILPFYLTAMFSLQVPRSENEWKLAAREFKKRWHFPHCIGAVDGKHVEISYVYWTVHHLDS